VVAPGGTLRVRNTLGGIEAIGIEEATAGDGAATAARVEGTLRVWARDGAAHAEILAAQVTLAVENGPDGVAVVVKHPPETRGLALDLRVYVPGGIKTSLLSLAGDVRAQRVRGGVVLATQSGDVMAREVRGDVAAETATGDIGIEGVIGNVLASSASGDIVLLRVAGQSVRALGQSGDVRLEEVASTSVSVETVSGDVEMRSLLGTSQMRVRTVSGDVHASGPDRAGRVPLRHGKRLCPFDAPGPAHRSTDAGDRVRRRRTRAAPARPGR
jgi:hypothetical protein